MDDVVDIFDHDCGLAAMVDGLGRSECPRTQRIAVPAGAYIPHIGSKTVGLLVLSGFLLRRTTIAECSEAELLGPGDLVRHDDLTDEDSYEMVPSDVAWVALESVEVAVLDSEFARWASDQLPLRDALATRFARRMRTLSLRLVLSRLPRVSSRLHFLLWHLADRFGRVTGSGVVLPVRLSHALLAEMVAAQRPTVSRSMKELERIGLVSRRANGVCLHGLSPARRRLD